MITFEVRPNQSRNRTGWSVYDLRDGCFTYGIFKTKRRAVTACEEAEQYRVELDAIIAAQQTKDAARIASEAAFKAARKAVRIAARAAAACQMSFGF